jgi:hypothetical protein
MAAMRQPNWSPSFLLRPNNLQPNSRPPTASATGKPRPIRGAGAATGPSGASPDVTKRLPPVASCSKEWFGSNADIRVGEAFPATQASSSSFEPESISKFGSACPNPFVNVELAPGMPYVYSKPGRKNRHCRHRRRDVSRNQGRAVDGELACQRSR